MNFDSLSSITKVKGSSLESSGVSLPRNPQENTLCFSKSKKFLLELLSSLEGEKNKKLGLVITSELWKESARELNSNSNFNWIATAKSFEQALIDISKIFYEEKFSSIQNLVDGRQLGTCEIDPNAEIAQNVFLGDRVKIAKGVKIHPGCIVSSDVEIGEGTVLYPNVSIYPFSKIGKNCRFQSGVVIGADGFGYSFIDGEHQKIWHFGGVEIGNGVELGANVTVDMGTFIPTRIGDGSKIDNLCMIAHNVQLGKGVIICGQSGCAGSSIVGDYTFISGHCAIGNDTVIGSGCKIAGGSTVMKDVQNGETVAGYPAINIKDWRRSMIHVQRLAKK